MSQEYWLIDSPERSVQYNTYIILLKTTCKTDEHHFNHCGEGVVIMVLVLSVNRGACVNEGTITTIQPPKLLAKMKRQVM
jgi:hypothetical protein